MWPMFFELACCAILYLGFSAGNFAWENLLAKRKLFGSAQLWLFLALVLAVAALSVVPGRLLVAALNAILRLQ